MNARQILIGDHVFVVYCNYKPVTIMISKGIIQRKLYNASSLEQYWVNIKNRMTTMTDTDENDPRLLPVAKDHIFYHHTNALEKAKASVIYWYPNIHHLFRFDASYGAFLPPSSARETITRELPHLADDASYV